MNQKSSILKPLLIMIVIFSVSMLVYIFVSAYMKSRNSPYIDVSSIELVQLEAPEEGDPIAIVDTSLGEIRFVLYPEYAPNAVKNFTELAESGYYTDTYIFHSESGAYCGAGAPNKDGTLPDGYDKDRELVKRELSSNLWPLKGAVCCLTSTVDKSFLETLFGGGDYYCGSRLAFLNTIEMTDEEKETLKSSSGSEELADAFIEKGGIPNFSQQLTIIGQTYEGFDVMEKLSSLETYGAEDGMYKIPKEDIMIKSVTIGEYSSSEEPETTANN